MADWSASTRWQESCRIRVPAHVVPNLDGVVRITAVLLLVSVVFVVVQGRRRITALGSPSITLASLGITPGRSI